MATEGLKSPKYAQPRCAHDPYAWQHACFVQRSLLITILWACWTVSSSSGWGESSQVYGLFQRRDFLQVGDFTFSNLPSQPGYSEYWVWGLELDDFKEAYLNTPQGSRYPLVVQAGGALGGGDHEFSAGPYSFNFIRENDSSFSVDLTLPAPEYASTPKLLNLLSTEIEAGVDLELELQPDSGAREEDYLMMMVQGSNMQSAGGWFFHTPWPGQAGAMSGLSRSVTVPGHYLKPNDILLIRLIYYRVNYQRSLPGEEGLALAGSGVGVFTTLFVPDQPQGNDVSHYSLFSGRVFQQEGPSTHTPAVQAGFEFEASVWAREAERLSQVNLAGPGGAAFLLKSDDAAVHWQMIQVHDTEDQLLAAAPSGEYEWLFDGFMNGRRTAISMFQHGSWPAPLFVANWTALQTSSFTDEVVVRWNLPPGVLPDDQIEFAVVDQEKEVVYRYPDLSSGDSILHGAETEIVIPADWLLDGEEYEGRLRYIRIVAQDAEQVTGATGFVGRYAETRFPMGLQVAAPLEFISIDLPLGSIGEEYLAHLQAAGGRLPLSWSVKEGAFPRGLTLSSSGRIEGIPYENGAYELRVQVADSLGNTANQLISISVAGSLAPLSITTTGLPDLGDGLFAYLPLSRAGGAPPFLWSISSGQLPPGIELHAESGLISGIADEAGTFPLEIELQDGAGQMERRLFHLNVPSATYAPMRILEFGPIENTGPLGLALERELRFRLRANAEAEELITIQTSPDLALWNTLLSTPARADGFVEWSHPDQGKVFFRAGRGAPEPEYNPVSIHLSFEPNSGVAGLLTKEGLYLSATNSAGVVWHLEFPANAVTRNTLISMALLESAEGFPFEVGFLGGVAFEPEGLILLEPATLTAVFPEDLPPDTTGFGFGEDGADFHLYPISIRDNALSFPITHFSGVMGGTTKAENRKSMMTMNMACSSRTSREAQIAYLIDQGGDEAKIWAYLMEWLHEVIFPKLKESIHNDELLWLSMGEFFTWANLATKYASPSQQNSVRLLRTSGEKLLARGFANAVNRARTRCFTQHRAFQAVRMMKMGHIAHHLELGRYLEEPDFFDEPRMLERYIRAFRFELQLESKLEMKPKGGGRFTAEVLSGKCIIEASDYDHYSEDDLQRLTRGEQWWLLSVNWRLASPGQRVQPVVGTDGELHPIDLSIKPNYTPSRDKCGKGPAWEDPLAPTIVCVFRAVDPVQQMKVRLNGGWKIIDIGPEASQNWYGAFKLFHATHLVNFVDKWGKAHLRVPRIEDDWTYEARELFAEARFTGTPRYAHNAGGLVKEDTTLRLFHAPLP
jgi:hypothetical protein